MSKLKVICAWCHPGKGDSNTSHGICSECAKEYEKKIKALKRAKGKKKNE